MDRTSMEYYTTHFPWKAKECVVCGKKFIPMHHGGKRVTCGDACMKINALATANRTQKEFQKRNPGYRTRHYKKLVENARKNEEAAE